mgnify:CR=1 FL=1
MHSLKITIMRNRFSLLPFLVLITLLTLSRCQSSGIKDVNPAESDQWQLMTKVSGHETNSSERFEANGNPLMITYQTEASGEYTHCHLEVYMVKGIEEMFTDPVITILNKKETKGKKLIRQEAGQSYYLRAKPLEMHYSIKVYQKKDEPTSTT